jgi:TM2 domain-containing membrane protein YozV
MTQPPGPEQGQPEPRDSSSSGEEPTIPEPLPPVHDAGTPPPPPPGYEQQGWQQPQPGYAPPPQQDWQQPQPGYGQPLPSYAGQMSAGAPYGIHPGTGLPYSDKSKLVAGILQIFVSGVGRMYIGQVGLGVAQLLVAIFTCGIGALWSIIDGIMILTKDDAKDAQGRILKSS